MYFSVWSKAACLWSAGFADLTWSWKLQTLKYEMCNRFRVKLCLIQPEKPTITHRWPLCTANEPWFHPKEEKKLAISTTNASAVLCYSAAVKARRKMDVSLFADCEIGYIGKKKNNLLIFSGALCCHFHCIFCKHMYLFTFPQPHISIRCTAADL